MKPGVRKIGLGGWFTIIALACSALAVAGSVMLDIAGTVGVLSALAAVAAVVTLLVGRDIVSFATLAFAVAAACMFVYEELYTIATELQAIDSVGFSGAFVFTAAALALALVAAFAATFPSQARRA